MRRLRACRPARDACRRAHAGYLHFLQTCVENSRCRVMWDWQHGSVAPGVSHCVWHGELRSPGRNRDACHGTLLIRPSSLAKLIPRFDFYQHPILHLSTPGLCANLWPRLHGVHGDPQSSIPALWRKIFQSMWHAANEAPSKVPHADTCPYATFLQSVMHAQLCRCLASSS